MCLCINTTIHHTKILKPLTATDDTEVYKICTKIDKTTLESVFMRLRYTLNKTYNTDEKLLLITKKYNILGKPYMKISKGFHAYVSRGGSQ